MAKTFFDSEFLKKLELLNVLSKKIFSGKIRGEKRSTKRGASVEFVDYRQYVPGDDFRYIDWRAYARLEDFFLKLWARTEASNAGEPAVIFSNDKTLGVNPCFSGDFRTSTQARCRFCVTRR